MSAVMPASRSWLARLNLEYSQKNERTVISRRQHEGPLTIQRPFYPEGDVCHTYLLHPPGGIVGGDELNLSVKVNPHAHALLTTPASTKFYRSNGELAKQYQHLQVASQAVIEWMPQETIIFNAARCETVTEVHLDDGARFAGWEILCQGRPAAGEKFIQGECRQRLEIFRQGKPLVIERTRLRGETEIQRAQWGMAGFPVVGTMLVTDCDKNVLEQLVEFQTDGDVRCSVTLINNVLVCRYLGKQGIEAREWFTGIWQKIRETWIDKPACLPRIWQT